MTQPTFLSIPAGDWVQAASNIIGVLLTVWATLWLAGRPQRKHRKRLVRALVELERCADTVASKLPPEPSIEAARASALAQRFLMKAIGQYKYARSTVEIEYLIDWQSLSELDNAIAVNEAVLAAEQKAIEDAGHHEQVFLINHQKAASAAVAVHQAAALGAEILGAPARRASQEG